MTSGFAKTHLSKAKIRTVHKNYKCFKGFFNDLLDNEIPYKVIYSRTNLTWVNRNLKRLVSQKQWFNKAKKTGEKLHWEVYIVHKKVRRHLAILYISGILHNFESTSNLKKWLDVHR